MAPPNNALNINSPNHTGTSRSNSTRPSPSKTPSVNAIGRSPSLRGGLARPARGGTSRSSPQTSFLNTNTTNLDSAGAEDARAENIALLDELRARVEKAENASEEYQRQLNLLQARLDESQQSHSQLEDQLHGKNEKVEELEMEKVQATRQKREVDSIFESERAVMIKDREEQNAREDEMRSTIQRLKETLAQREARSSLDDSKGLSRSC